MPGFGIRDPGITIRQPGLWMPIVRARIGLLNVKGIEPRYLNVMKFRVLALDLITF